ncbi:MAG: nucleotidyltransferase family protein [Verrucomicrobiaceae bacterium]|nr:nucleotidyltransferase family protein [Verrucomicrobiaceae bacterium]
MSAGTHIVILAAGSSSRLGSPKQLIDWHGQPLLRHLAQQAIATGAPVTVILGANAEIIRPTIADLPLTIVENDQWPEGMSSSVRLAATRIDAGALLLMTCDQPFVTTETLRALIGARITSHHRIVASEYEGTVGVPALFDRSLFTTLCGLTGAQGAKSLICRHLFETIRLPFPAGKFDLDTPADLVRAQAATGG